MEARRPRFDVFAAIALGGAVGALGRAALVEAWPIRTGAWPWATFAANVAGAFLLALVATRVQERVPPTRLVRPLLGTGFCGALTTFSTLQIEAIRLVRAGATATAVGYVAASLACGVAAVVVASQLIRRAGLR